ncbi:MAG: alpha/beta fold hydrolase [Bryobacterales bacterium]|nr:alpha/beta fold hydrolase [Bryobacterales bacterium]
MAVPQLAYWKSPQTGEPFLFLHGLLRRAGCFAPLYPALAHRWEVYSIDQAGRGDSPQLDASAYRVLDHLPSLERFVDEVMPQERPAVVYGHSMGAMLALALAVARPSRVRAIVLEDPRFRRWARGSRARRSMPISRRSRHKWGAAYRRANSATRYCPAAPLCARSATRPNYALWRARLRWPIHA